MKRRLFYIVVGLQLLFLIGIAVNAQITLARGRTVILKTVPVDPRSLFMGNYMILSYEISTINLKEVSQNDNIADYKPGKTVYVFLNEQKSGATPVLISLAKPIEENREPVIRGKITSRSSSTITVDYGIDRYYIPEKKEEAVWNLRGEITVEVALKSDGQAIIRRVMVNGKPLKL